ncbi:class I SAM-dependent methyltransferase [Xanthobacter tagetidis]|uniref:Class I SAM-dependent methyltransferase n=1 Tax=Xanthobacter tagetidis TaxID=60216 RepID=A0A3L7ABS8_9HYPH|nr:class I SAM-dependent methyltransferase [Xanthobacter tagetidis]MBB6309628.1 hypothetical protein [Xanthobacter tagetidis]RLP77178.1 class I SAM-dependent methyltransferase [Xanthobacter tagetidis]
MSVQNQRLVDYCRSGRKKVNGWFARNDAELFLRILDLQQELGVSGSAVEIGVHHGKSFVPLCLALTGSEKALCIDIFDDQSLNVDNSGQGNRAVFEANLGKFGIEPARTIIRKASSLDVKPQEITEAVGPVRFFSVDGGHWHDIVINDLDLAAATLAEGGVIALDDFLKQAWPDVSYGFFDWHREKGQDFAPIAMGTSKLYLARKSFAQKYLDGLMASPEIRSRIYKVYDFMGVKVPVLIEPYPAFVIAAKNKLAESNGELLDKLLALKRRYMS